MSLARLSSVCRAHMLVMVEDDFAEQVAHRHDRVLEAALRPCLRGAILALGGETVDVFAREPSSVAIRSAPMPCGA